MHAGPPSDAPNSTTRRLPAASSPGAIKGVLEALRDMDVRHLLDKISMPTLVLHRHGDRAVRIGAGRHLASHIPHAKFVELDGADHWVFAGDQQSVLDNVRRFVEGRRKIQP